LDILTIPQFAEIFGQGLGQRLSGANTGPTYPGGARKSEIMRCCYRTPGSIITAAHALGMGLLRQQGIIREWAITDQKEWYRLGYLVDGGFKATNSKITIRRPPENNGNPLSSYDDLSLVQFKKFPSKDAELEFVIDSIKQAINQNNLNPAHHLIVIPLGKQVKQIQKNITSKLQQAGINTYLPGADNINTTSIDDNRSQFWWDQAVTISGIHRSKGNEAYWVFLVGLEQVAMEEKDRLLRNQLFVGMTRTKGWLTMTGISSPDEEEYGLYREIEQALATPNKITFTLKYDNS
jgi:superfamily I DNA and RNA helicase